jgi:hypothetical protein
VFDILPTGELTIKRTALGLRQLVAFTNPGSFTFTKSSYPGLTRLRVRVIGGGGGGGGTAGVGSGGSTCSAGGGGGGYSESVLDAASLAASVPITVGAGGAGGVGGAAGASGGASSFGTVTANGGQGSPQAGNNSATGSTVAFGGYGAPVGSGQIAVPGGGSSSGFALSNFVSVAGGGGDASGGYGPGGAPAGPANGGGYGGGGCGTATVNGGGSANGGNGAGGAVLLELFF